MNDQHTTPAPPETTVETTPTTGSEPASFPSLLSSPHWLSDPRVAQLRELFGRIGVSRLAEITGLDTFGIPVVSAIRPAARSLSVFSGRGETTAAAAVAASMEAIEAWAAETCRPPCIHGSYLQLRTSRRIVDPRLLPHRAPIRPAAETWWTEAEELLTGERVLVPFDAVHTDWTQPPSALGLVQDSAGIGAGFEPSAAARHALLELIERDALAVASARAQSAGEPLPPLTPAVTAASCGPRTAELADQLEAHGARVRLVDLRSDAAIPAIAAVLSDADSQVFRPVPVTMGTAADTDPDAAAARALTEAAQSRLITIAGARDDLLPAEYDRILDPAARCALDTRLRSAPPPCTTAPTAEPGAAIAALGPEDLAARITALTGEPVLSLQLGALRTSGAEITVTRVWAPGLEGSGAQYGTPCLPGKRALAITEGAGS